jgi:PAS domain S-box-containing protein
MSSKTVLLVEDDACIALDEGNALKRLGYKVFITDSGENAVELAANIATVGLILMDIDLGKGIDGIEAARRILATQELPIVFLTSHSEQGTAAQVSGIRHYGYVLKNSGNFVLQTTIEMAFELFEAFRRIKEKNETLVQEQFLLNAILNNSPDYIYFKDGMGRFIRASKALAQALDVADPSRLIGKTDFEYLTKGRAQQAYEDEQAIIRTGEPLIKEEKEVGTNHPDLWVLTEKMPLRDEQGKIIGTFGVSRDITERKRAEKRAEYHIRLYATLSKVYRTIACIKSQAELFDKICETIVITGKFRAAWIGVLDGTCAGIDILAHNAQCNGSLPPESEIYREIQLANSPFGKAIHSGNVILYEDLTIIDRNKGRKAEARSSAAIPLKLREKVVGILNIHATASGVFTHEEQGLLEEIGSDISFALDKLKLGKELNHAMGCVDAA